MPISLVASWVKPHYQEIIKESKAAMQDMLSSKGISATVSKEATEQLLPLIAKCVEKAANAPSLLASLDKSLNPPALAMPEEVSTELKILKDGMTPEVAERLTRAFNTGRQKACEVMLTKREAAMSSGAQAKR